MSAFLVLLTFLKILFVTTAIFGHLALNGHPRNYPACDTSHGVAMATIKTSPPPLFLAFLPWKSTNRCLIEHLPLSSAFCEDCLRQFRFGPNGAWPEMIVWLTTLRPKIYRRLSFLPFFSSTITTTQVSLPLLNWKNSATVHGKELGDAIHWPLIGHARTE